VVRIKVSDPGRLHELIRYLREAGCVAEQARADTLDVFMPSVPNEREARMELGSISQRGAFRIRAWRPKSSQIQCARWTNHTASTRTNAAHPSADESISYRGRSGQA